MKEPAGTTTISGQSAQSRKTWPGSKRAGVVDAPAAARRWCRRRCRLRHPGGGAGLGPVRAGRLRHRRRRGSRGRCRRGLCHGRWRGRSERAGRSRCGSRRIRGSAEVELLQQRRGDPRHDLVARCARDTDAGAIESLLGGLVRRTQLLDQLGDQNAVRIGAFTVIGDRARRRREQRERAFRRAERRETQRRGAEPALERIAARRIDDDDLDLRALAMHVGQNIVDADAVAADVVFRPDLRVHRNQVSCAVRPEGRSR